MRAAAIGLLFAACAPPAATPPIAHHAEVEQPKPLGQPKPLFDRRLSVGSHEPTASRMTWELRIDGSRANLVETEQEAAGIFTIEKADREAKWTTTRTYTEKGPVRHVGDHIALDLESDKDSLFLRCWHRSIDVAPAGARRVERPGHNTDCSDPGVWSPATTTRIDALVCGQGDALDDGQASSDLDETLWRFAAAPGIEFVEVNDDCFQSTGLRLAK